MPPLAGSAHRTRLLYKSSFLEIQLRYATEAGTALIPYAFRETKIQRLQAPHFPQNPVSIRVIAKIVFSPESTNPPREEQPPRKRRFLRFLRGETVGLAQARQFCVGL